MTRAVAAFRVSVSLWLGLLFAALTLATACADDDLADASTITFHVHNESDVSISLPPGGWLVIEGLPFPVSLTSAEVVPNAPLFESELCDGAKPADVGDIPPPGTTVAAGAEFDYAWRTNAFVGQECEPNFNGETCCAKVARVGDGRYVARVCARLAGTICPGPTFPPLVCLLVPIVVDDRNREVDVTFTSEHFPSSTCP